MFMVKHLNHTKRCEVTLSFSSNPGSSLPELGSSDYCPCVSSQEQDVCVCAHTHVYKCSYHTHRSAVCF